MPPVRRNYLSIVQDGKVRLENNSPVNNFNAQGTSKGFIDIIGLELERFYNSLEGVSTAIDPTRAVGLDLDKLGYLVGELRDSAVTASDYSKTNFRFYLDTRLNWTITNLIKRNYSQEEQNDLVNKEFVILDSDNDPSTLVIPQGTVVQTFDGSVSYTTTEDAHLSGNNGAGYVGIIATSAGPISNVQTNVLVSHLLANVPELRRISQFIKCSNRYPIQNGKYSLSDEEFRYRISTARSAIRSNELSIRRSVLSVPGIRDALFEKNKFGNGTVNIIVDGDSPLLSDGLIGAVKEKVQQELSYGDVIYVSKPEYLGVELDFAIRTDPIANSDSNILRSQARAAIIQYINDLPIGGEIIWNEIITAVLSIEGIVDFIPRIFKYGEYDSFNKINKKQIILRFINQRAMYNQKWYTDSGLIQCCSI